MIKIETQIHGYKQGHQLLDSSADLPKSDQKIVDRLSDVAGPIRPGEVFEPYLSAYPLPSGRHYVLARTWPDVEVSRAGCVRTLSLVIPTAAWASAQGLKPFLDLLDRDTLPSAAESLTLLEPRAEPLPPAPAFRASELLEAMFLEEAKPVAVFDAPLPELIALRLLTALWPALRARFALSTFALSPRKIEGRSFDLVFSPKDARSKFSDWPGRRIDATQGQGSRHRWTGAIVDRVFDSPIPWLLDGREMRLIGLDGSSTTSALRIALLWDELIAKVEQSPSAALGLLDIANSRMHGDSEAVLALRPKLVDAAHRAVAKLSAPEAWDFIGAMARKMHGTTFEAGVPAIASAAAALSAKSPAGAIAILEQPDPQGAIQSLASQIAEGLSEHFGSRAAQALTKAKPETFARLISASERLAQTILSKPLLIEQLAKGLPELTPPTFEAVREAVLPLLINDSHIVVARPLLASLDAAQLMIEVRHLAAVNGLAVLEYIAPIVERARELDSISSLREVLVGVSGSSGRDHFLGATVRPLAEDIEWLLTENRVEAALAERILLDVLRDAEDEPFRELLTKNGALGQAVLRKIPNEAADVLLRAFSKVQLPLDVYLETVRRLLPVSAPRQKSEMAQESLRRCLREHFSGDEAGTLSMLLGAVGKGLDGKWAAQHGLGNKLASSVLNRNLVAFQNAPKAARVRIVDAIDHIAQSLSGRYILELDELAAISCAQMLWDAHATNPSGLARASVRLLPTLLRARRAPVSAMIASTFPFVYRTLEKKGEASELYTILPFFEWDRCKAARRELVDAFLQSTVWRPSDLALSACRASEVRKILSRTAESAGGGRYVDRIIADLERLPAPCQEQVARAVEQIRSKQTS